MSKFSVVSGVKLRREKDFRLNICLVNNLYPPINTGSSFYTRDLAYNLVRRGHNVIVITNLVKGTKLSEIKDKVKIYRLPVIKLPRLKIWMRFPDFNFTLTPKNLKKFKEIIIQEKIEIIHQCNNIFDLVFASSHFASRLNIPLICSVTTQIQHLNPIYNKLLEIFDKIFIYLLFSRKVNRYIALDKETVRYVNERYNFYNNVSIIPYSIPPQEESKSLTEYKRDYKKTHYKMVSLGHISDIKDRWETIRAWKYVVQKYPQAQLAIVGDLFTDKSANLIKKLGLGKNIVLTGRLKHKSIFKYFKVDFGGVLLTTNIPYYKGFGTANIETMASGLPIIADADSNFFGDKFPIKANEHFVKAVNRNPRWLAAKFIELFENAKMRERIGKAGQKFVREVLTWDKIIDEIELVYKDAST